MISMREYFFRSTLSLMLGFILAVILCAAGNLFKIFSSPSYYLAAGAGPQHAIYNEYGHKFDFPSSRFKFNTKNNSVKLIDEKTGKVYGSFSRDGVLIFRDDIGISVIYQFFIFLLSSLLLFWLLSYLRYFQDLVSSLKNALKNLNIFDYFVVVALTIFAMSKTAIIDVVALDDVVSGLHSGVNYYIVSLVQAIHGQLPTFPYNPLTLYFLAVISKIKYILVHLGFNVSGAAIIQESFLAFYYWLAFEITCFVRERGISEWTKRKIFYFVIFNPFSIYYVVFVGQTDIISVAFIFSGMRRLFLSRRIIWSITLISVGVALGKPQHLLVMLVLFLCSGCVEGGREAKLYIAKLSASLFFIFAVYWWYKYFPGFYLSLAHNPQAMRVSWSSWWELLSGAIVINRPIGMMIVSIFFFNSISPSKLKLEETMLVALFGIGVIFASFQASFAHTFGVSIFLLPAVILSALMSKSVVKLLFYYLASIGLLATWGTGLVGDVTNSIGLSLFTSPSLLQRHFMGISYSDILNTIEYTSYIGFEITFLTYLSQLKPSDANDLKK